MHAGIYWYIEAQVSAATQANSSLSGVVYYYPHRDICFKAVFSCSDPCMRLLYHIDWKHWRRLLLSTPWRLFQGCVLMFWLLHAVQHMEVCMTCFCRAQMFLLWYPEFCAVYYPDVKQITRGMKRNTKVKTETVKMSFTSVVVMFWCSQPHRTDQFINQIALYLD